MVVDKIGVGSEPARIAISLGRACVRFCGGTAAGGNQSPGIHILSPQVKPQRLIQNIRLPDCGLTMNEYFPIRLPTS
jgi:hypothetical protein